MLQKVEQIPNAEAESLIRGVTKLYVEAISGISQIVAERDAINESADEFPPVLPHELAVLEPSALCAIVWWHHERLLSRWATTEIDAIEQEHQELVAVYAQEQPLQAALKACDEKTTFEEAWGIVKGCFEVLQRFCGGLTSVFQGTSQVESDFSIVKGEKTMFKQALIDLSLEAYGDVEASLAVSVVVFPRAV